MCSLSQGVPIHIFQEDLDKFLQLAQKLKLEGLTGFMEKFESPIMKNDLPLNEEEKLNENSLAPSSFKSRRKNLILEH